MAREWAASPAAVTPVAIRPRTYLPMTIIKRYRVKVTKYTKVI